MRHAQARLVDALVTVDEQVEIDDPRAPALATNASERALDLEQELERARGVRARLDRDRAVQEPRLVDDPDRVGLAQLRDGDDLDAVGRPEELDRSPQRRLARAEIRAEPDVRARHDRAPVTRASARR